jgi:glycine betaine/proline transport system ATP-binding protein
MRKMRELQVSEMYVVGSDRRVFGIVRDDDVAKLAQDRALSIESVIVTDYPWASPDTPIVDLYHLAAMNTIPVAVKDEEERMLGIVPRVSLLTAVSGEVSQDDS